MADVTRQALGNVAVVLRDRMTQAVKQKDAKAFEKAAADFMAMGREVDEFLGTRAEYLLGKWIDDARSWAANDAEKEYYEKNARIIITTWGGHSAQLTDYANRQWNGLMRDYYLPRWQMLIDATLAGLKSGKPVDKKALDKQWCDHNWKFATTVGGDYSAKPKGDSFAMSRTLFDKYSGLGWIKD